MLALLTLCLTQIGQVQVPHPRLELSAPSSFETNPVHQPWGCWLNRRPGHLSTDPMWLPLSEKFQQQPKNLSDCLRWQQKCCHMLIYSGPDVILHHSWNYIYKAVNNVPANVCFFQTCARPLCARIPGLAGFPNGDETGWGCKNYPRVHQRCWQHKTHPQ